MINCKIVSPQKEIFSGKVRDIILPAFRGECQILPDHAESFFLLKKGKIILHLEKGRKEFEVSAGIFHIANNSSLILVNV